MKRGWLLLLGVLAGGAPGCSALLSDDVTQCAQNSDCEALGFKGWVCSKSNVCIADPEGHGGSGGGGGSAPVGGNDIAGESAGGAQSSGAMSAGGSVAAGGGVTAGGGGVSTAGASGAGSGGKAGAGGNGGNGGSGGSGPPPCNSAMCAAANGSCSMGACEIHCTNAECIPQCPSGMPCRVICDNGTCNAGLVDCSKASSCDITCGNSSCFKGVNCAGSSCVVGCADQACSIVPIVCQAKSCDLNCPGLQSCKELRCLGAAQTCSIECGGVQSCGTSFQSTAPQTTIVCTEQGSCSAMITACCNGSAKCSGMYAPHCN